MKFKIFLLMGAILLSPIQAQEAPLKNDIEIENIVTPVLLFFNVFSNSRGCVNGKVANLIVKKIIDANIETKSLCLNKTNRANFKISWELDHQTDYFSDKKKILFHPKGSLTISIKDKILSASIEGLKYKLFKGAIIKIKLLNFVEGAQQLSIKSLSQLIPIELTANIRYLLEYFHFQYLYVFGVKIKLKDRSVP